MPQTSDNRRGVAPKCKGLTRVTSALFRPAARRTPGRPRGRHCSGQRLRPPVLRARPESDRGSLPSGILGGDLLPATATWPAMMPAAWASCSQRSRSRRHGRCSARAAATGRRACSARLAGMSRAGGAQAPGRLLRHHRAAPVAAGTRLDQHPRPGAHPARAPGPGHARSGSSGCSSPGPPPPRLHGHGHLCRRQRRGAARGRQPVDALAGHRHALSCRCSRTPCCCWRTRASARTGIDRMWTHLALAGVFARVRGIVLGSFTQCEEKDAPLLQRRAAARAGRRRPGCRVLPDSRSATETRTSRCPWACASASTPAIAGSLSWSRRSAG